MTSNSELIILNYTKIRDNAIVVHTLSRDFGRKSFLVNVGRNASMAMFQPLGIVEAEISDSNKSDLWRASRFCPAYPLNGIRTSMVKNSMTLFMSEVLYRTVKDGAREDGLYDWCVKSILTLDALDQDFSNYHLRWLMELSSALGFAPSVEALLPFAENHLDDIRQLVTSPFGECMMLPLSGVRRNELCEVLIKYLSHHTESHLEIRSLRVLRELFA